MSRHADVPQHVLDELRAICLGLPEATEEQAWAGVRWVVSKHNFAHVVHIEDGWPAAYAAAAGNEGPLTVLTFRATADELDAYEHSGYPYFRPVWFADIAGIAVDDSTDWDEITELVTESYCLLAPKRLAALVDRPTSPDG